MNLTIEKLHFYKNHQLKTAKKETISEEKYSSCSLLPSFEIAQVFKNQILFTSKKQELEKIKEKYNLKLSTEELEAIFTPNSVDSKRKIKAAKRGDRAFRVCLRETLHRKYPKKTEGELTYIISNYPKVKNKARILTTLIPQNLLTKDSEGKPNELLYGQYFDLLLTKIIEKGKEDGYRDVSSFLKEFVSPILISEKQEIKPNIHEIFSNALNRANINPDDVHLQVRVSNGGYKYQFFYKKQLILEEYSEIVQLEKETKTEFIKKAISLIESGEINSQKPIRKSKYRNYKYPDEKRIKKLEKFQEKYGLKFNDINLLHQAFLFGTMGDNSVMSHADTYQVLEFIGDGVLNFCLHEILTDILPEKRRNWLVEKIYGKFSNNSYLTEISKKMKLGDYTIHVGNSPAGNKRHADMFEALIDAIYLDNGIDGLDKAYEFLYNNFKDVLLKM